MSVVLRPAQPASQAAGIGFAAALAVADAVSGLLPAHVPVMLKWPNDVLLGGGKAAGILTEASAGADGRLDWLVLGIGINLAEAPKAALYPTATLADFMPAPSSERALELLTAALGHRLSVWERDGFAGIRHDWLARAHAVGTALTVKRPDGEIHGTFIDLDEDGTLILQTGSGQTRIAAGDVHLPAL
jgi:BirA family biotin operon repressor/biotin-[acetyl-CoA-carboxylase] ligase